MSKDRWQVRDVGPEDDELGPGPEQDGLDLFPGCWFEKAVGFIVWIILILAIGYFFLFV